MNTENEFVPSRDLPEDHPARAPGAEHGPYVPVAPKFADDLLNAVSNGDISIPQLLAAAEMACDVAADCYDGKDAAAKWDAWRSVATKLVELRAQVEKLEKL